jgi:hypothetical protein
VSIHARRFFWATANPIECTAMLDEFVAHPEFLAYPLTPEQARVAGADLLTNTANLVWTTYNGRDLTGCVILTRIIPRVDALVHFMMIDKDLASKRKLLRNLLGYCFRELGFNRLSMEVPEGVRLERFARKVLDFRLEGEIRPRNPELPKGLSDNWVARQGSRREQAYFDGKTWHDVVLLRLLAREWVEPREVECRSEPQHRFSPLSGPVSAPSPEVAGPVTPSPSSPRISSPSDSRTSDSSSTC